MGKEIGAGGDVPLQGLAYVLISRTQTIGLGCDRAPPFRLKSATTQRTAEAGKKSVLGFRS